ncbi:hypothetical protein AMTR_s00009p00224110 [Amborella trichopoda]|uniref:Sec-independent protein translocase protein TATB, chloroplastic n=1 Tax=Amborella trichopoda TaxID=13333 RepID=W1NID4_AMBTC|nr:hypothetical protein AMTR_s00009p00224110 [Amborella trichopoda]
MPNRPLYSHPPYSPTPTIQNHIFLYPIPNVVENCLPLSVVSVYLASVQDRDKKGKRRLRGIYASLFGVGAPEALVIGVVALLVFGPKGLAEVARNLGKTLRAFQPTIRELQDVSREFKTTLEREIGLDEVPTSMKNNGNSTSPYMNNQQPMENPSVSPTAQRPYSSEEYLKVTEEQIIASVAKQQEQTSRSQGRTEGLKLTFGL